MLGIHLPQPGNQDTVLPTCLCWTPRTARGNAQDRGVAGMVKAREMCGNYIVLDIWRTGLGG